MVSFFSALLIPVALLKLHVNRNFYFQDNLEELHYLKEERDNANEDIKDLEDELADSKIMVIKYIKNRDPV